MECSHCQNSGWAGRKQRARSFYCFFFPSFGQTQLEARDRGGWVTLPYRSTSRGPEMVRGRAGWGTDLMAERIAGIPRPDWFLETPSATHSLEIMMLCRKSDLQDWGVGGGEGRKEIEDTFIFSALQSSVIFLHLLFISQQLCKVHITEVDKYFLLKSYVLESGLDLTFCL